jgi:hypothetical protein
MSTFRVRLQHSVREGDGACPPFFVTLYRHVDLPFPP